MVFKLLYILLPLRPSINMSPVPLMDCLMVVNSPLNPLNDVYSMLNTCTCELPVNESINTSPETPGVIIESTPYVFIMSALTCLHNEYVASNRFTCEFGSSSSSLMGDPLNAGSGLGANFSTVILSSLNTGIKLSFLHAIC